MAEMHDENSSQHFMMSKDQIEYSVIDLYYLIKLCMYENEHLQKFRNLLRLN